LYIKRSGDLLHPFIQSNQRAEQGFCSLQKDFWACPRQRGWRNDMERGPESTPLGALGLSLIRGLGEYEPGRPRVYGHTTFRIPFDRSSGIVFLVYAGLTAPGFLMAIMILSGLDGLKRKKSSKM